MALPNWATTALRGLAVAVAALAVWEVLYRAHILDNASFPSAIDAVKALGKATATSEFWSAVWRTLEAWALGLLIGTGAGIVVGVLTGLNEFAYRSLNLLVEFLKTVPVVAALPLAILIFGTTVKMNVMPGGPGHHLAGPDPGGVRGPVGRAHGARHRDGLPYDRTGPVAERRAAQRGPVHRHRPATRLHERAAARGRGPVDRRRWRTGLSDLRGPDSNLLPQMYALVIVVGLLGVLITAVFGRLERHALRWHESQRSVVI